MKTLFIVIFGLLAFMLIAALTMAVGMAWWSKNNPPLLGLEEGHLKPCPESPNCVCSELGHANMPALSLKGMPNNMTLYYLENAVKHAGGRIEKRTGTYLWATFKTPLLGYVDDLEARIDHAASQLYLRSASRVGHSDFGQNKRRVEEIGRFFREQSQE